MGTHAKCVVYRKYPEEPIAALYSHFDGGLNHFGKLLIDYLKDAKIHKCLVQKPTEKDFAGIECMFASLVAYFKKEPGNYYLMPYMDQDRLGCDYLYHIWEQDGELYIRIRQYKDYVYNGKLKDAITLMSTT